MVFVNKVLLFKYEINGKEIRTQAIKEFRLINMPFNYLCVLGRLLKKC